MSPSAFLSLAWQSIVAPREVARLLLSLRLGHEAIVLAFALVVVLQTALVTVSSMLIPPDPSVAPILMQPMVFAVGLCAVLLVLTLALTWAGRGVGGVAQVAEIALLVVWIQGLDVVVQAVLVLLAPVVPGLAGIISLAASGVGIWILLNFLAEAQEFEGLLKAALVMVLAVTGLALGISLVISLSGATMGLNANV